MTNVHRGKRYRCWPVYALAVSVPVSMAAISLSKLALLLGLLLALGKVDATAPAMAAPTAVTPARMEAS